jgi:hypothetical protein
MWLSLFAILSIGIAFSPSVLAAPIEQSPEKSINEDLDASLTPVTAVSQLSQVQPEDWAFQAIQSLAERYKCIEGYPDRNFQGNRVLTRYEFAAGLNACLARLNQMLETTTAGSVRAEDLAVLQRLQQEFTAELAMLGEKVGGLEGRTLAIEKQQFSTTTKLTGEAIFALTDVLTGDDNQTRVNQASSDTTPTQNAVLANRIRLNFDTSFSGKDLLRLRFQSGNFDVPGFTIAAQPGFPNREGIQTFNVIRPFPNTQSCCIASTSPNGTANPGAIYLSSLLYRFPIGKTTKVAVIASGGEHADYVPTLNPYFEDFDGGNGSLSTFGQRSPIYRMGSSFGSGVGITTQLNRVLEFSLGYLANGTGNFPGQYGGFLDGSFSALAQLTITPSDRFSLGLTYNYTYLTAITNTNFAEVAGTKLTTANTFVPEDTYNNSFGVAATFRVSPKLVINGWVTTTNGRDFTIPRGSSDYYYTWSYALALAFPDLGKKGNLGGIVLGVEPYLTGFYLDGARVPFQQAFPFRVEGFYKHQLTDNFSITGGLIWLTAPNQSNANPDVVIGTLRGTFVF